MLLCMHQNRLYFYQSRLTARGGGGPMVVTNSLTNPALMQPQFKCASGWRGCKLAHKVQPRTSTPTCGRLFFVETSAIVGQMTGRWADR